MAPESAAIIETPEPAPAPRRRIRAWLMRGEATVATIGITVAAIVLAVLVACASWMMHTQSRALEASRRGQLVTASQVLAEAAERVLAVGEVSTVRRLVMDTARRFEADHLRIVLPSGDVIADNDPALITADVSGAIWQKLPAEEPVVESRDNTLTIRQPLAVDGYGTAYLEMTAPLATNPNQMWEAQAGVGAIGVTSLLALLLAYRHFRQRLAAMGVIRESLIALGSGEESETALAVDNQLGREAATWNALLEERRRRRREAAVADVRTRVGDRRGGNSDLSSGCDAMSQGVILVNEQMRVTYANNAAAVFLGAQRDQLLNAPVIDYIRDATLAHVVHDAVMNRKRAMHVHDRRAGGGEGGVIRFAVRPVRESDHAAALIVIDDVTQQRVAEEARHEFVAQATHELRTPLTNIRLYLETAIDEGDQDKALRAKCLNIINDETLRLERMVGDMLQVAEIESGTLQVKRDDVRVGQMLKDIQTEYQAQAAEKDLKLEFNIPPKLPVVQGDRDKLIMAVQNLVANALKYTPDGGRVAVTAEVKDTELRLDVADTGIGISHENQLRVFDKFYRANDKRITGITGSGLGLALARQIARLHGGDITLESEVDQGSTFTLTLPIPANAETSQTE